MKNHAAKPRAETFRGTSTRHIAFLLALTSLAGLSARESGPNIVTMNINDVKNTGDECALAVDVCVDDVTVLPPELEGEAKLQNDSSSKERQTRAIGTVSKEQYYFARYIIQYTLRIPIAVVGILSNAMNLAVLTRPAMKHSINIYLAFLAANDIVYLVCDIIRTIPDIVSLTQPVIGSWLKAIFYVPVQFFTQHAAGRTSTLLILVSTLERLYAVLYPLHVRSFFLNRHNILVSISIILLSSLSFFPYFFRNSVQSMTLSDNTTYYYTAVTEFGALEGVRIFGLVGQIVLQYIPTAIIILANPMIIAMVIKSAHHRRDIKSGYQTNEVTTSNTATQRLSIMLVITTTVYVISGMPHMSMSILSKIDRTYSSRGSEKYLYYTILNSGGVLYDIRAAMNFFIYMTFGTNYKHIFYGIFCRWRKGT